MELDEKTGRKCISNWNWKREIDKNASQTVNGEEN